MTTVNHRVGFLSLPQRRHAHVEGDGGHDSAAVNTISTRTILIAITNMLAIGIFAVIISTTLEVATNTF